MAKNHQRAHGLFRAALESYHFTPPQFGILAFLWKQDGLSQAQLGTLMSMDRTTLSGIIDRLEKRSLVERREHPGDRRAHLIYLTPEGLTCRDELGQAADKINAAISDNLTEAEKEQLVGLLQKMRYPGDRQEGCQPE